MEKNMLSQQQQITRMLSFIGLNLIKLWTKNLSGLKSVYLISGIIISLSLFIFEHGFKVKRTLDGLHFYPWECLLIYFYLPNYIFNICAHIHMYIS